MAGYSLEITDKKIVEHELIRSEEKYRTYVENSADVVCITDLDYNVFYKSPNNHIVFGYLASELVGTMFPALSIRVTENLWIIPANG